MKKFLINLLIFAAINLFLAVAYLVITQNLYSYHNWETKSVLLAVPKNKNYDLVILGASNGRSLSDAKNHLLVEKILGKKIFNLSKAAAGPIPEKAYLRYFYENGNSAKKIVYFLNPYAFYSDAWNEKLAFLNAEPLYLKFFEIAVKNGSSKEVLLSYVRSKFTLSWLAGIKPLPENSGPDDELTKIDSEQVQNQLKFLYPNGLDKAAFSRYTDTLKKIVELAHKNNSELIFAFPPTLVNEQPGKEEVKNFVLALGKENAGVRFFDWSQTIGDIRLYMDLDHLNAAGVGVFAKLIAESL
ncbi:MAG: hypothetical protein UW81_C0004G0010 [Candidatus Giovannonibacteria bacterium GW2011_GWC2_44_9]|uniref:SGNH hydrolase-type esterase domain-containing protein n=3 Tax=Candidatus Giovannoniibacteriota TaxID=1752738 RepID=A0A0G1IY14_9BACT|nr:MAG: hypothetical protein UW49_C0001G0022 [Candidatus Giovannonibacteria bacterium GW2011_GWB1_44_23]KKT64296.1 MAG: hypothetical protein UW57_C0001G0023 [Candidatus Giovannonibacteria bacterium GW2011_GWA1_44_29]KKT84249.1 MAG: hypothetical protein UW81_C0004G0010 [Candidatus Giovannonibacteria bacterium GW2011_GWC2_44_9]KKT92023.1 MAG: hypothetical protein UW93_C0001G0022 [Parcubacteria group bacterium GW2011_GWC1_45_13]